MKKTICFALSLILACVLTLSACNSETSNQTDNSNQIYNNNDNYQHQYNPSLDITGSPTLENPSEDQPSHEHIFESRTRIGNTWRFTCKCGEIYTENIDFFQEIINFAEANGECNNYTYKCMVGSDISSGYTYNRYVSYDSINRELCFTLTFGQYMTLEIYMTGISREYNYYFEDRESHCFIRGIIDTNQCANSFYCFTNRDNIENTNVGGTLLYDFAETVQSQVKLFIACFNNDYAAYNITAQDFCFPALN